MGKCQGDMNSLAGTGLPQFPAPKLGLAELPTSCSKGIFCFNDAKEGASTVEPDHSILQCCPKHCEVQLTIELSPRSALAFITLRGNTASIKTSSVQL